jgi:hypothetical protein
MPSNPTDRDEVLGLLELAQRRVRTLEGARLYGKPIGSVIGDGLPGAEDSKRPITIERLKSLQAQFEDAKATNNTALMKDIQAQFTAALRGYQATRQDPVRLRELVGARGRQDQAKVT